MKYKVNRKRESYSEAGKKGGQAVLEKLGKIHFIKMSQKAKRARDSKNAQEPSSTIEIPEN